MRKTNRQSKFELRSVSAFKVFFFSLAVTLFSAPITWSSALLPTAYACPHNELTVFAADKNLAARVCDVVTAADPYLTSCGLPDNEPLRLHVVRHIEGAPQHCLGVYVCDTNEIAIIDPITLSEDHTKIASYKSLEPYELFDSLVVHGIAHARIAKALGDKKISVASHEYIAYAMQIASLQTQELKKLLIRAPKGHADEHAINELVLSFNPEYFFGLVWLHFEAPENGCDFVKSLINGSTTLGLPPIK